MNVDLKVVKEEKYGIFNKIYYSIIKPSKYEKMAGFGLRKACSYFICLISIIAIILAILATFKVKKIISTGEQYINNNISELTFKNNELSSNEEIILTNKEITDMFAYSIIINTNVSVDEAKLSYINTKSDYDTVILLKNSFLIMNKDNKEFLEYSYGESLKNFGIENEKEYGKQDIISYFNSTSSIAYIFQYFSLYFITYLIIYIVIITIVVLFGCIIKSILKKKMSKHELAEYAIYSITSSVVIFLTYLLINFFTNFAISYFEIIILIISIIYMFLAIKSKNEEGLIIDCQYENQENKDEYKTFNENDVNNEEKSDSGNVED